MDFKDFTPPPIDVSFQKPSAKKHEEVSEETGKIEGREVIVKSTQDLKEPDTPQDKAIQKTEQSRKDWFEILSRPIKLAGFALTKIGKKFTDFVNKIQMAISNLFSFKVINLQDVSKKSQDTGEKVVKELLEGKATDVDQFKKDIVRGDYTWQNKKMDESEINRFKDEKYFGENGFKNMSLLLVQSLSSDLTNTLNDLFGVINFGCPVRILYSIQEEGKEVKLSASYIFAMKEAKADLSGAVYSNFFKVDREISMSKEEFMKDWSQVSENDRVPTLKIKDVYSQDIKAQEVAKRIPSGNETATALKNNTVESVLVDEVVRKY